MTAHYSPRGSRPRGRGDAGSGRVDARDAVYRWALAVVSARRI